MPPEWARRMVAWRESTSPSEAKYAVDFKVWRDAIGGDPRFYDVREPLGISVFKFKPPVIFEDNVKNLHNLRYTRKQATLQSKVVEPSWNRHYPELGAGQRWGLNWKILATVPIAFLREVETYHFFCLRFYNARTVGWPEAVPEMENSQSRSQSRSQSQSQSQRLVQLPNNKSECSLCGQVEETLRHLFTECSVSLRLARNCFRVETTPLFIQLLCPELPPSQTRWNREYVRWVLYIASLIKWARSRRANRDPNLETPPSAKDFDKIQQALLKKLDVMELYLKKRKKAE